MTLLSNELRKISEITIIDKIIDSLGNCISLKIEKYEFQYLENGHRQLIKHIDNKLIRYRHINNGKYKYIYFDVTNKQLSDSIYISRNNKIDYKSDLFFSTYFKTLNRCEDYLICKYNSNGDLAESIFECNNGFRIINYYYEYY
jgi:hypothetical protein